MQDLLLIITVEELKDIVQDLYELMVQAAAYDQVGSGIKSRDVLIDTMYAWPREHYTLQNLINT